MQFRDLNKILITSILILYLSSFAAADDKLKPVLDEIYGVIKTIAGKLRDIFFSFFPSFEDYLTETMDFIDKNFPIMKDFHWIIYLAIFFAVMAILSKLWEISRYYIINSVIGIILLLILIHILEVKIKITLLTLIIVTLFGVPGILFILILHYCGIVI